MSLWIRLCNHTYIHTYIRVQGGSHVHLVSAGAAVCYRVSTLQPHAMHWQACDDTSRRISLNRASLQSMRSTCCS